MPTLNFDVLWRDRGAKRGLQDLASSSDEAGRGFDGLKASAVAGAAVAGAAIWQFAKDSVQAYSEAEASQAKLANAFEKFPMLADTSLSALQGLNSELALKTKYDDDATASGQAVLAQFKLTGQQITQLTPLLQDYAAKTGKDLPAAAKDLGKAMLGQGKALKGIGIDFKDAGSTGANFEQVMAGLRTQVGGFAENEGKTAAGQAAILQNQFGELQEEVGARLLPALLKVGGVLLDTAGFVQENASVIGPLVVGVTALAAAVWTVNKASAAWTATQAAWTTVMGTSTAATTAQTAAVLRLQTAMAALTPVLAVVGAGVAGVWAGDKIGEWSSANVAVGRLTTGMRESADQARLSQAEIELFANRGIFGLGKRIDSSSEALDAFGRSATAALGQGWGDRLDRMLDMGAAVSKFEERTSQLDDAFASLVQGGNIDAARERMALYERAAAEQGVSMEALRAQFPKYAAALAAAKPPVDAVSTAIARQTRSARANVKALREQANALLGMRGSENSYEAAIDDATAALKENGRTLNANTARGRANRAALDNIASSALGFRDATKAAGGSVARQNAILEDARQALTAQAKRFGMTGKAADAYARDVLGIPSRRDTKILLEAARARAAVRNFTAAMNGVRSKTVTLTVVNRTVNELIAINRDRYPRQAAGGPYTAGRAFWVGEEGPELRVESSNGRTLSHADSMRAVSSARSLTRVQGRTTAAAPASVGAEIDYARLGDHVARAFTRAGVSVSLDGRAVGRVIGGQADLLGRAG